MKVSVKFEIPAVESLNLSEDYLHGRIARACGVGPSALLSHRILKRSLDARGKPAVKILYQVLAEIREGVRPANRVEPPPPETEEWHVPESAGSLREPVVIGAGPCGLFAGLVLALAGANPVIVERGRDVVRRKCDIDRFFSSRVVNPESNLLFGEGGAGTWSDGKLFTRIRDPRCDFVLREFAAAGADGEILYFSHPHIGSDRLPEIIAGIREKIISLGGKFLWDVRAEGVVPGERFTAFKLSDGSILPAPAAIAAPGHGAREFLLSLTRSGIAHRMKGFQIGCRVEHPQEFINLMQFGTETPCAALGAAEYIMASRPSNGIPGATTFCMCPGGEVIPAVCEPGRLSTNGMSRAARSGKFGNAAVVTGIPEDVFSTPEEAFGFLNRLEESAWLAGGSDCSAPAQRAEDYLNRRMGRTPSETSYRFGLRSARLDSLLPETAAEALAEALNHFDRLARGYVRNGVLIGPETRVSSPVRFDRNPETLESSMANLYIGGEGGGAAGGIVSAAVDGIRLAEAMLGKKR